MILETADLHLNDNARDTYRHVFMEKTLPAMIRKYEVDLLLILGDLCDDKDRHSAWLVNKVVTHLRALTALCPVVILRGNHDYIDVDNPFFEFLNFLPNITWISRPTSAKDLLRDKPKVSRALGNALLLPHTANYKRDWKELSFAGYDRVYAHQTFAGANVGPRRLKGIPLETFPEDANVISGDIHVPQHFDVFTYIGSPYTVDFGDAFKPRVLLRDGNDQQSIPVPGRQKRLVQISSLNELKKQSMLNPGDILKVRVALKAADHAEWPRMQEAVHVWGRENGYQIYLVQPQVERTVSQRGTRSSAPEQERRSDEELMEVYAQSRAVNAVTLKAGMNLMRKV